MIPDVRDSLPPPSLMPDRIYTLPELRYPEHLNVGEALLDANAEGDHGGRIAIQAGERHLSYAELAKQVNRLCHGLRSAGLDTGDRVLLRLPNVPEFIVAWLACQKLGIVTVGTMPMLRPRVPEGCAHFHRDILASADSYARHVLAPTPDDRFGGHPTLAFTFGTGGLLVFPLRFGAATVLSPSFTPESMLETFARHRVTIC